MAEGTIEMGRGHVRGEQNRREKRGEREETVARIVDERGRTTERRQRWRENMIEERRKREKREKREEITRMVVKEKE